MMKSLLMAILFLIMLPVLASAQTCSVKVDATNTVALLAEIPSLDSELTNCPQKLPVSNFIVGGDVVVQVDMNSGVQEHFTIEINNGNIDGLKRRQAACKNKIVIDENNLDTVLSSQSRAVTFLNLYGNKKIQVKGCTIWRKVINFFAQPVGRWSARRQAPQLSPAVAPPAVTGKPDNCDDTYLPGHREYSPNKQLWDSYSAVTSGVCQMQTGHLPPSDKCKHTVQLSINSLPYYLCWYN